MMAAVGVLSQPALLRPYHERVAEASLTYHRRVAGEKRAAILGAATRLFIDEGYDGASLARVAEAADVSTATLFKQFPTKADLFEAIVTAFWSDAPGAAGSPSVDDPASALRSLGERYAALLLRPGMAGLHRMVIAEAPRFRELARIQFDLGKEPFFERVRDYLVAADEAGTMRVPDATSAATQFTGMIANFVIWPAMLLVDWSLSADEVDRVVDDAVRTLLARFGGSPIDPAATAPVGGRGRASR